MNRNLIDSNTPKDLKFITLAMEDFHISESQFGLVPGIYKSHVGYTEGSQSVQFYYSPLEISYKEILDMFIESSNQMDKNQEEKNKIIFYNNDDEKQIAESEVSSRNTENITAKAFQSFKIAEESHQKYYLQKDSKLYTYFLELYSVNFWDFVNSTSALRFNSYIAGYGSKDMILEDCNKLNLPDNLKSYLIK